MVLHYHDMNWAYYSRIYLNPTPTPLDFSLLDTDHFVSDENNYKSVVIEERKKVGFGRTENEPFTIINVLLQEPTEYVKIEVEIKADIGLHANMLQAQIGTKTLSQVCLKRPLINEGEYNSYAFYAMIPKRRKSNFLSITVNGWGNFSGYVKNLKVTQLKP